MYQNSFLYFLLDKKEECLRLLANLSAKIPNTNLSNEMFAMMAEDLYYLKLILNDKATDEEAHRFRSILRAKRLNFQNSIFQPVYPEVIIALEAKIDTKLGSRETKKWKN